MSRVQTWSSGLDFVLEEMWIYLSGVNCDPVLRWQVQKRGLYLLIKLFNAGLIEDMNGDGYGKQESCG